MANVTPQILPIAQIGEPILRKPTRRVSPGELATPKVQGFIDDLIATKRDKNGAGLAANQVFSPLRICVIEVKDNPRYPYKPEIPLRVLINPVIKAITDETFSNYEGCLSVPNLRGVVERPVGIRVEAMDRNGEFSKEEIWGLSAGTFQHECDHLDGKLFLDRVSDTRTLCTWETFEKHHRAVFVERVEALVARFGS